MDVDQVPAPGTSVSLQVPSSRFGSSAITLDLNTFGQNIHIITLFVQNLNSLTPELVLPNGTVLKGKYEETIGSFLFFTKPASPAADATDTSTVIQPQYIGHTEQQLVLTAQSPFVQNT